MQKNSKIVTVAALSLSTVLIGASAPQHGWAHGAHKHVQSVTVTVDEKGYTPSTIKLKAGRPVHLIFHSKGESCANSIVIPSLKQRFYLKPGQKREVVFTPKRGQTIAFACSMNMFKGKISAK